MIHCPPSVRIAIPPDAEELFRFIWEAREETRHAKKDEGKIRETIARATNQRQNPVFGVIRGAGGIEGAVGLSFDAWWCSLESAMISFFFFVHPDYRRTNHAADLRGFSAWFAAQLGMPLYLMDWSGQETGKTRLFERHGRRVGSMFEQVAA